MVYFGTTRYCYEKDKYFEIFLGYHFTSEEVYGENVFAMQPVYGFDQRDDVTVFYKKKTIKYWKQPQTENRQHVPYL